MKYETLQNIKLVACILPSHNMIGDFVFHFRCMVCERDIPMFPKYEVNLWITSTALTSIDKSMLMRNARWDLYVGALTVEQVQEMIDQLLEYKDFRPAWEDMIGRRRDDLVKILSRFVKGQNH